MLFRVLVLERPTKDRKEFGDGKHMRRMEMFRQGVQLLCSQVEVVERHLEMRRMFGIGSRY